MKIFNGCCTISLLSSLLSSLYLSHSPFSLPLSEPLLTSISNPLSTSLDPRPTPSLRRKERKTLNSNTHPPPPPPPLAPDLDPNSDAKFFQIFLQPYFANPHHQVLYLFEISPCFWVFFLWTLDCDLIDHSLVFKDLQQILKIFDLSTDFHTL